MKLKQKLNNVQDFIPVKDIRYGIIETVDGKLVLGRNNCKLLLDYITNLQEKNEKLLKIKKYIEEAIENGNYFEDDIATDISKPTYDKYVNSSFLLNILRGI